MILSRVVVLNHYWRITESIKSLMYNKLIQLYHREAGPRHQQGQFHGHVASVVTQVLRTAWTWGFIFCSHHLWILNDFIFTFVGCKWSPVGHMWGTWTLSSYAFLPLATFLGQAGSQLPTPRFGTWVPFRTLPFPCPSPATRQLPFLKKNDTELYDIWP